MAISYFIILIIFSLAASIIALYVLIIGSFQKKDKKEEFPYDFVKRDSRTIKSNIPNNPTSTPVDTSANARISALIWTVLIGQLVTLYFSLTFLNGVKTIPLLLRINGTILLIASILCSILTIGNAWYKKKMVVSFRLSFQGYSLIVAIMLFILAAGKGSNLEKVIASARAFPNIVIIMYFTTVIIALALMLIDNLYRKHERVDYNFNIYFRIVILVGMLVGLSVLFAT